MEDLLFGLTPGEFWAWNYLVHLAQRQRSTHVILPRPGEDPGAEKIFSRKHLKRLIKALKTKRHLTHIIYPRSKSKQIEVFLPASKIGDIHVLNGEKGYSEVPNNEGRGARMSPITTLRTPMSPISREIQTTLPDYCNLKLELNTILKRLLKLKQKELKTQLWTMGPQILVELGKALGRICRHEPKGRKLSIQAKIYAVIRFLQEGEAITRPQAWIDTVAREGQREMEAMWRKKSTESASGERGQISKAGHM
jgi:hypothetical protein